MAKPVLTVILSHADLAVQRGHLARGALFLPEPEPLPEPFAEITLRVETASGDHVELDGRVLQILPGHGIAVSFDDMAVASAVLAQIFNEALTGEEGATFVFWGRIERKTTRPPVEDSLAPAEAEVEAALAAGAVTEEAAPAADEKESEAKGPELDETARTELEIAAMNTNQKMQLAMRGGRVARLLLLKDVNKNLQSFILQNPRITLDEVRALAMNRQALPDVLNTIAANREWSANQSIISALVRNPKTPGAIVTKFVDKLPMAEVRRIAKANDVPGPLMAAARKRVAEGSK